MIGKNAIPVLRKDTTNVKIGQSASINDYLEEIVGVLFIELSYSKQAGSKMYPLF